MYKGERERELPADSSHFKTNSEPEAKSQEAWTYIQNSHTVAETFDHWWLLGRVCLNRKLETRARVRIQPRHPNWWCIHSAIHFHLISVSNRRLFHQIITVSHGGSCVHLFLALLSHWFLQLCVNFCVTFHKAKVEQERQCCLPRVSSEVQETNSRQMMLTLHVY